MKTLLALFSLTVVPGCLVGQREPAPNARGDAYARVEVQAFDTRGRFLGAPTVDLFESEDDHANIASRFHAGVADRVAFGVYRIEAHLTAYYAETRYVGIYQPQATIVVGLAFGYELPRVPLKLRGRVVGKARFSEARFIRLVGVYSSLLAESAIGSNVDFDLAGLSWGQYLLLVVGESGILASRPISIPYTGPPLRIQIGSGNVASAR